MSSLPLQNKTISPITDSPIKKVRLNPKPCKFFAQGNCKVGADCSMSHLIQSTNSVKENNSNGKSDGKESNGVEMHGKQNFSQKEVKTGQNEAKGGQKKTKCANFVKGKCSYGDKCKFEHVVEMEVASPMTKYVENVVKVNLCRAFSNGSCKFGDKCKFTHDFSSNVNKNSHNDLKEEKEEKEIVSSSLIANTESSTEKHLTGSTFNSLKIAASSQRALKEVFQYEYMTVVQESTLGVILSGKDCLAKAKTGTGKTLAFLIPSVELLGAKSLGVSVLILSPTRELAAQIEKEATMLLSFHANKSVVCIVGGTNINKDKKKLVGSISFLIATPGRMIDHLENTPDFSNLLKSLRMLILDEADQLLEMGFKPSIDRILQHLPSKNQRHTLLFSATIPTAVREIANNTLRSGFEYVDTVGEESEQTHEHVFQEVVTTSLEDQLSCLCELLDERMVNDFKIIVFLTTARLAGYYFDFFTSMKYPVLEIHSRMSQSQRTKVSERFRSSKNLILFSSDVSARGMDYPDITHVLQVGMTEKAQYIHRLGRTARAGKEGAGVLLLADFEERAMLKELQDISLNRKNAINDSKAKIKCDVALKSVDGNYELNKSAQQAYQAWLGYYNGKLKLLGWSKEQLVDRANLFSRLCGLSQVPALEKKTVGKMGLKGVRGLRFV